MTGDEDSRGVSSVEDTGRPAEVSAGARVLIVEDEFLIALDIETALVDAGYTVVGVARNAERAVALAVGTQPLLVIMDIRLAGTRDGIDAAIEIYRRSGIRCIFATAHGDRETMLRAESARPIGWLSKPYTTATLMRAVRQAITSL